MSRIAKVFLVAVLVLATIPPSEGRAESRLRLIVETDLGGDPDDEQSMVRFLLYSNEWDVQGIICNRAEARNGENLNKERTGLGIMRALLTAYRECYPNLIKHDRRYPKPDTLWKRTVAGYADHDEAVDLIIRAVDSPDPRPLWYSDWGTDVGSAPNNLRRALDRVLQERGPEEYARFKSRLRLSSSDAFGPHTRQIDPPFPLWVDTYHPEVDRKRWYHRFSEITATAGGFDVIRDLLSVGPLGRLYPTNTTHRQKEGDSMTFLYLVPTGMNDPDQPGWGSWAGRYGHNEQEGNRPYFWASQPDLWQGTSHRDNTLRRWAADLQNDFRARLQWCVTDRAHANHPPKPVVLGALRRAAGSGDTVHLDARLSSDPDRQPLQYRWRFYPEAGTYTGPLPSITGESEPRASFVAPKVNDERILHLILAVTDTGSPPLTRYKRIIVTVLPPNLP